MSDEPAFLTSLLDELVEEVNTVLNNSDIPVVEKDGTFKAQGIPSSSSDTWIKLPDDGHERLPVGGHEGARWRT
ncbi:hypothetical protein [Dietzia sp. 179-F 9C3 NHS]|uniref:hypothetical protein n=1 Tax=Dietzia sp. 179-F 9C3 NHS TaxID=3374295 RepID=UPI00387A3728